MLKDYHAPTTPGSDDNDITMKMLALSRPRCTIAPWWVQAPLRIGFDSYPGKWTFGFWLDLVIDFIFVVDLFLNFRTGARTSHTCARVSRPPRGWRIGPS